MIYKLTCLITLIEWINCVEILPLIHDDVELISGKVIPADKTNFMSLHRHPYPYAIQPVS